MTDPVSIAVLSVVLLLFLVAALGLLLRRLKKKTAVDLRLEVQEDGISCVDESANFFGLESRETGQIRGNGCLILTGRELVFRMWLPRRTVRIPVDRIEAVEEAKSHLGKTKFIPLLKVQFENEEGDKDSAAWAVHDIGPWLEQLQG